MSTISVGLNAQMNALHPNHHGQEPGIAHQLHRLSLGVIAGDGDPSRQPGKPDQGEQDAQARNHENQEREVIPNI